MKENTISIKNILTRIAHVIVVALFLIIGVCSLPNVTKLAPDNAIVFADSGLSTYHSPFHRHTDPQKYDWDAMSSISMRDAKDMGHKVDEGCSEYFYFYSGSPLSNWFEDIGVTHKEERWDSEGKWNYDTIDVHAPPPGPPY